MVKVWTLRRRGWEVETGRSEGVDPEEAWLGGVKVWTLRRRG